jgi:nucleoside-diphosphate-sugar epimerase
MGHLGGRWSMGWTLRVRLSQCRRRPKEAIHNEVFNVGDTSHNYRVREIADVVGEVFPGCRVSFGAPGQDNWSYRVSFEKIRKHLPGFRCGWDVRRGQTTSRSFRGGST